jgi:hypothetical protein
MIGLVFLFPLMISCYYMSIVTHPGSPLNSIEQLEYGLTHEFKSVEVKRNGRVITDS